ncbi:MAG TPA: hypothetical protein VK324_12965, partial [Tepidisphaeraceae bacterium]|nr:hypothetical protein [Tepidisphaeraceae bacterium]
AAVTSARAAKDERRYHADAAVRQAADAAAARTRYTIATAAASRVAAAFPADVPTANVTAGEVTPASDKGAVAPTAPATDLPAAVAAALTGQAGRPVRAVVLLTDGRQTTDGDPAALTAVAAAAVPVFPVKLTATAPPADVAVAGVDVPPRAFVGETVPVAVRIRSDAAGPAALDVRLAVEGQPPQQKKVTLDDGGRGAAEFGVKAEAAGTLVLSVTFDKVGDEQVVTNNVAHRRVRVLADKLKVAAYAGAPAWDFQYLRNALQRSAWASAQDAVLATGGRLPLTPKEIAEQDVVVLADVPAAAVDDAQWDALNQLVAERGGSVIFMPGDVGRLAEYAARPLAQSLLPYRAEVKPAWRVWPGERSGLRVVPAEGRADALPLAEAPAESAKRWQALPPVFRVLSPPALKLNARPLLIEAESKSPVVIESRVGRGRSIFVGVNETWRWRYKVGERDQDRFLTGLVRYAVDAPYAARDGGVALDVEKAAVAPGEAVRVRAKVLGDEGLPVAGPPTVVRVTPSGDAARAGDGGAAVAAVPLTESDAPGRFTGTLSDLPAGTYEVSIEAAGKRVALPLIVETTTERELVDLSGGDAMPKRLAESTGGAVFDVEDLERLPALLASAGDPRSRILERPLWDGPWVYGIVLACLGTEWALRKRFGLA